MPTSIDLFSGLGGNEAATDMQRLILGHLDLSSLRLLRAVSHQYMLLVRECIQRSEWRHKRANFEELSMAMWAEGTFRSVMLPGHEDAVCSLAFRGSLLASGSRDCTARLWAVRDTSGAPEAVLKHVLAHPNLVTCVALNSEASVLSSGCYDQLIRLWSTESGECTNVLTGHSGTVWAAQWSAAAPRPSQRRCSPPCSALPPPTPPRRPGGRAGPLLLSGAGYPECCVSLWDTEQGTRVASSSGHTKAVRALAVGQGALQGVLVRRVHAHYTGTARALALHGRCKQCLCTSTFLPATHPGCTPSRRASAVPRPRPCRTPRPRHRHHNHHRVRGRGRGRVHSSGGAGERLLYLLWQVSGSYDLSVRLWDSATLRCVGTRLGHAREVCTRAATLRIPIAPQLHAVPQAPCPPPHASRPLPRTPAPPWQVFSVAAGSARIASGSVDRTICLWDGRAPECTATLTHGGGGHQWSLAMLGEHNLFAGSGDGAVRIWDLRRMPTGETAAASGGAAAAGAAGGLVACMSAESGGQQHKAGSCALALDHESGRRMASGGPSICVRQLPSQ